MDRINNVQGEVDKPVSTTSMAANRIFGKFSLLANLGAGGSGEVFLALSRSAVGGVNKLVVIKRLRNFAEDDARSQAQEMFLNEARLATLLNHPNIVQTNDVGLEDEHMFLTMEYLEGQPLNAILRGAATRSTKLDVAIGVRIVSDSLAGLHYAHELRDYAGTPLSIVHRDLSPHNLFVTYEGMTKVVDFGIAKTAGGAKTEQGVIKGKFAYMAPEQAADDKVDRRADVFVMGIVLWEILTGERLVYRRNEIQTIHRLLNDTFAPPSSVRSEVTPELDAVVMKALQKDPAARYQTAQEMREALEKVLVSSGRLVRHDEVGALVCEMFSAERAAIRQRIQQCIASAQEGVGLDSLPALTSRGTDNTPNRASRVEITVTPESMPGTLGGTVGGGPNTASVIVAPPRRSRVAIVAGLFGVVCIAGIFAIVARSGHSETSPSAAAAAAPAVTTSSAITEPQAPVQAVSVPAPADAPVVAASVPSATAVTPTVTPRPQAQPPRNRGGAAPRPPAPPPPVVVAPPAPSPTPPAATTRPRVFNTSL